MKEDLAEFEDTYMGKYRLLHITINTRLPKSIKEWIICFWNFDLFFPGGIPFLKLTLLLNVLVYGVLC